MPSSAIRESTTLVSSARQAGQYTPSRYCSPLHGHRARMLLRWSTHVAQPLLSPGRTAQQWHANSGQAHCLPDLYDGATIGVDQPIDETTLADVAAIQVGDRPQGVARLSDVCANSG